jgi:hypothetical protein
LQFASYEVAQSFLGTCIGGLLSAGSSPESASAPTQSCVLSPNWGSHLLTVSVSSPVGAVSTRPGFPLAVSRTPSAILPVPILFSDPVNEDSSFSGVPLVLSCSFRPDLLPERVALPLDDFGYSASVAPLWMNLVLSVRFLD